jgi:alanyl-tRNA synthetase
VQQQQETLSAITGALKAQPTEVVAKRQSTDRSGQVAGEGTGPSQIEAGLQPGRRPGAQAVDVKGIKVLAAVLEGADVATLRETMDKLKDKLKSAAIVLAAVDGGKVSLIAGVTADTGKVKAGELVNAVAQQVGGKGGGRPDMAQAGGTNPAALPAALASVKAWVEGRV